MSKLYPRFPKKGKKTTLAVERTDKPNRLSQKKTTLAVERTDKPNRLSHAMFNVWLLQPSTAAASIMEASPSSTNPCVWQRCDSDTLFHFINTLFPSL
jgi:hypothetical protein